MKGWGAKEFGMSLKTQERPNFWLRYWPTNRTGENRIGEPRPLDWTLGTSVDAFVGRFVRAFVERPENGEINPRGCRRGTLVGDLVGALVGPLVVPLMDPLVGRGSLSLALCVAQLSP